MKVTSRYSLLTLFTVEMVCTFDMVYVVDMVYTVDMVYSVDMVSLLLTLLTIFLQSKLLCTVSTYHTATTERNITAVAQDELPEHTPHTL